METNSFLNALLKGRGKKNDDENAGQIVAEVIGAAQQISLPDKLFSDGRNRSYSFEENHFVGCDRKNLDELKEVAFSRAIFNQKYLSGKDSFWITMDYEVPLSVDNRQKVDLLALSPFQKQMVSVEYKVNPHHSTTGMEYGLLESFIYGLLTGRICKNADEKLRNDILRVLQNRIKLKDEFTAYQCLKTDKISGGFVLAAPVTYFVEFTRDNGDGPKKRFNRILALENQIKIALENEDLNCEFLGYLPFSEVSSESCAIIACVRDKACIPMLSYICPTINDLQQNLHHLSRK